MAQAEKLSAKQAAIQLGTDARTLRKFLRASDDFDAVGQGNRYEFDAKEMKKLKKLFNSTPKKKVNGTKVKDEVIDEEIDAYVQEQDEIDRTTEEVDLDDDGEPVDLEDPDADVDEDEIAFLEGPSDEELEEIELSDDDT